MTDNQQINLELVMTRTIKFLTMATWGRNSGGFRG